MSSRYKRLARFASFEAGWVPRSGHQFARAVLVLILVRLLATPPNLSAEVLAYVPQPAANQVTIFDTDAGRAVGQVPVGSGPIGVATDAAMQTVYVTNSGSGTVSVIDMKTQKVINTIQVGRGPIGVAVTPDGSRVYVANTADNTVSWFSAQTATPNGPSPATVTVRTISGLQQQPYGVAASSNGKSIYVTLRSSNQIAVISTATNKVTSSLGTAALPSGIAETTIAYQSGGLERTQPLLLAADAGSSLSSAFDPQKNETFAPIPTGVEPVAVGTFPFLGSPAYIANNGSQSLTVISAKPVQRAGVLNYSTSDIALPADPTGVNGTPDGKFLWTVNNDGTMSQVNAANNKVVQSVPIGMPGSGLGQFIAPQSGGTDLPPLFPGTANLGVTATQVTADEYVPGSVNFSLTVHNAGPNTAKATELILDLPAGAQWTYPNLSNATAQGGCYYTSTTEMKCNFGDLAAGEQATVSPEVKLGSGTGDFKVTVADAFSHDPNTADNLLTGSINPVPSGPVAPSAPSDFQLGQSNGAIEVSSPAPLYSPALAPWAQITLPKGVLADPVIAKTLGCESSSAYGLTVLKCPLVYPGATCSNLDSPLFNVCTPGSDIKTYNATFTLSRPAQVLFPLDFVKTKESKSGQILNTPIQVTVLDRKAQYVHSIDTTLAAVSVVGNAQQLGWIKVPHKCQDPQGVNFAALLGSCDDSAAIKLAQMISVIAATAIVTMFTGGEVIDALAGEEEATGMIVRTAGDITYTYE